MKMLLVVVHTLKYDGDKLSTEIVFFSRSASAFKTLIIPINNLYPSFQQLSVRTITEDFIYWPI